MPQPLVLRLGRIAEENPAEAGTYPLLRLVAGRLVAGGPGLDLIFVSGRVSQLAPAGGGMWDGGTTTWDGGTTTWDEIATAPAAWDGGATTWDGGLTTWDAAGPIA